MSAGQAPEQTGSAAVASGVAGRYATALFELAKENNSLEVVAADLAAIEGLINGDDAVKSLISNPLLGRAERGRAIAALLDNLQAVAGVKGVSDLTRKFLGATAANGRVDGLLAIIAAFRSLLAQERGEVTAEVVSAQALDAGQVKALTDKLKTIVGRDVTLDARVDPSLLGGLVVQIGSRMIDSSLKTKLQNLQVAMKEVG